MSSPQKVKIDPLPESSSDLRYPAWQQQYQDALVEGDPAKLLERVAEAEAAIFSRLQTLSENPDGRAEREAIQDAITALRVVKRETLAVPDWDSRMPPHPR
jgi:hypothetical protein